MDSEQHRRVDRRTFLKGGLIAGGLAAGAGLGIRALADSGGDSPSTPAFVPAPAETSRRHRPSSQPNILVIVVDQLRFPQWFGASSMGAGLAPNLRRLSEGAVSFSRYYTASNDCSPARAAMLTGLYTHQTGCMITGGSTLDPGFPTWGTMLREQGYKTRWLGKWHLTQHDGHWTPALGEAALEEYGFAGGIFPSPNGGPGQGWRIDPKIATGFAEWFRAEGRSEPWCTTVSFVNPHDIAWWYVWSDRVAAEAAARPTVSRLPPNFETPELLDQRRKPRLQRSLQETAAASFGPVPFEGPEAVPIWLSFLDLYAKLQREVDRHIGNVMRTLESRPEVAANTVIVFTSDHGEYAASHGLRGKGAAAYEEATRVPLIVKDRRGKLTSAPQTPRTQLASSVDLAPLMLSIATGSNAWRQEAHYAHLASRLDLSAILANPNAEGRPYILHATDEVVTEFAVESYSANAPLHIVSLRTPEAKYATYSHWFEGIEPTSAGREVELYDYSTSAGRLEVHNSADHSPLEQRLIEQHEHAFEHELREPLPQRLKPAHGRGFADYFSTARVAAAKAATRRKARSEQTVGQLTDHQGPTPPRERPAVRGASEPTGPGQRPKG